MKHREFLKTSLVASTAAATATVTHAVEAKPAATEREFYELRQYQLRHGRRSKDD